ncbi:uncharacterized protein [Anoplolepis gracilipes]|uniref:uncharacterized protein n=1 Tax=Anoplolepis gracilipes TaxID=354296 RepID=UPI003BA30A0F
MTWGSPRTDRRGVAVEEWAATLDLRLLNEGGISTCVRERGESVVDLIWASPATLNKVLGWKVATEVETLSDHRYIVYGLVVTPEQVLQRRRLRETTSPRRWSTKKMNEDAFMASILSATWLGRGESGEADRDIEQEVEWIRGAMSDACDGSMPRIKAGPQGRRAAYWWTGEIAELRRSSVHQRRKYARAKKKDRPVEEVRGLYQAYRVARDALRLEIKKAKARAWDELLSHLEENPWGRPYQMVLGKLRNRGPPATETLSPEALDRVVGGLFPQSEEEDTPFPIFARGGPEWSEDWRSRGKKWRGAGGDSAAPRPPDPMDSLGRHGLEPLR